nr:transposase (putative), gypsy type [Tanacetum cinerariifolium]
MSTITGIRYVLSQKAFDALYEKFHILEEVHPVPPDRGNTIHERPVGKIGLYTRFFNFANFRLHLSSFLVDILSVTPTVRLFRFFYVNSKKNGWMSFIKGSDRILHTAKNVTRDPASIAADFNVQDYATLVAHPSPFRKFPEEFLCLVGLSRHYTLDEETYPLFLDKDEEDMDIFAFIHTSNPTKVKVVKRERKEDEPRLLETTVGRIVPLLPVAPNHGENELDASVDKLFDKGGSDAQTEQGDSADGGGRITEPRARVSIGGKSMSAVQRLFAGAVQNAEVRGEPIPTMPFVTSSVSAIPEREGEGHTDSITGLNLRTISAPQRFVISSDSSHHSGANIAEAEANFFVRPFVLVLTATTTITSTDDPVVVVKEKIFKPSLFAVESTSAGRTDPAMAGLTDLTSSDFLWNVTNGSCLDDGGVCREMVDEFAPLKFFTFVRGMEYDQLFTEFNVGAARQMYLSDKVRMCAEYNIIEKRRLKSIVEEKDQLLKAREEEVENLKAQLLLKEAEVTEAIRLRAKTSKLKTVEKSLRKEHELADSTAQHTSIKSHNDNLADQVLDLQVFSFELKGKLSNYEYLTEWLEKFQDAQLKVINDKLEKLYIDFVEMSIHLEETFYQHLLATIAKRIWLLTYGMELVVAKCLNSPGYLPALGTTIRKATEKGMEDRLAAGITHGKEGRGVNFPLLVELKVDKDASIEAVINILRLEEHLAERLSFNKSQPHGDQVMVPIHHSSDKTAVGASTLW